MPDTHPTREQTAAQAVASGLAAGLISGLLLAWRGRIDNKTACSALNAPSHWLWDDEALKHDGPSVRYTVVGTVIHQASSLLWSSIYAWLQRRHRCPSVAAAAADAVAVTAVAAVVDLVVVPRRLTPGFERRLSAPSLGWVYGGFAVGLAIGAVRVMGRRLGGGRGMPF
jgi:hypothetical protein